MNEEVITCIDQYCRGILLLTVNQCMIITVSCVNEGSPLLFFVLTRGGMKGRTNDDDGDGDGDCEV